MAPGKRKRETEDDSIATRLAKLVGMQMTGGSSSIRAWYWPLREAGAAAREVKVRVKDGYNTYVVGIFPSADGAACVLSSDTVEEPPPAPASP